MLVIDRVGEVCHKFSSSSRRTVNRPVDSPLPEACATVQHPPGGIYPSGGPEARPCAETAVRRLQPYVYPMFLAPELRAGRAGRHG